MSILARMVLVTGFAMGPFVATALADDAANEALARRFYSVVNARNLDALDEFVAPDFVDHSAPPGAPQGFAGLKEGLKPFLASSSDIKIANDLVIVKGDYVTVLDTAKGTNDGAMMNMPASNKPFQFQALDLWLIKDGKLAEAWHVEQLLQMMMQIGAIGGANSLRRQAWAFTARRASTLTRLAR